MANMKSNHCTSVIYIYIYIYTWNFSDPCFEWNIGEKMHSLGGLAVKTPKQDKQVRSRYNPSTAQSTSSSENGVKHGMTKSQADRPVFCRGWDFAHLRLRAQLETSSACRNVRCWAQIFCWRWWTASWKNPSISTILAMCTPESRV